MELVEKENGREPSLRTFALKGTVGELLAGHQASETEAFDAVFKSNERTLDKMNRLVTKCSLALLCAICLALAIPAYCSRASNSSIAPSAKPDPIYGKTSEPFWAEHSRPTFGFQVSFALEDGITHNISHINMIITQPEVGIIAWNSPRSRLPIKRLELISEGILGGDQVTPAANCSAPPCSYVSDSSRWATSSRTSTPVQVWSIRRLTRRPRKSPGIHNFCPREA